MSGKKKASKPAAVQAVSKRDKRTEWGKRLVAIVLCVLMSLGVVSLSLVSIFS